VQLRRPWPDLEPAAPVELHDHHLLGEGFTLDVFVPADVAAAAGETAPARFLVEQTDAGLPEALPEETAPALPTPFEGLVFSAAVLADALDALETDAGFDAESPDHTEPGGRLSVSDTALEMPLFVVDRGEG
jgi:hypothetical protein